MKFLFAYVGVVPDLDKDDAWEQAQSKIRRGFPWLLDDNHEVRFLGIGRNWRGLRERERVRARAILRATDIFPLDVVVLWLVHFIAACVRAAKGESVVVLGSNPLPAFGVALAKALFPRRVPFVVRVQGFSTSRALYIRKSRWQYWVLNKIERFTVTRADLVITGNEATTKLALSHGVQHERVIVMPWPASVDAAEITDLPDRPTVLHAGRLEKEKGVYLLLEAMKWVVAKLPDATLLIAGGGGERQGMEELVERLGLGKNVSFLGWLKRPELMAVYKRSTVLVLPSVYDEGLGMVLVEAGLMGRPVVCSGTGGMGEVVKHGENGLIVPRGDVQALGEAMLKILSDPERAKQMGLVGKRFADDYLLGREKAVERVRQVVVNLFHE